MMRCFLVLILLLTAAGETLCGQNLYAEAQAQTNQYWAKKVLTCDGQLVMKYLAGDWKFINGGRWTLDAQGISPADSQNGLQWRGSSRLVGNTSRTWLPGQGFQPWEDGTGFGAFDIVVEKRSGRWTIAPNPYSAISQLIPAKCSDAPREPTRTEAAAAMNAELRGLCEHAKPGPNYQLGAVLGFVQRATDANSCRDEKGRTLLMMHIIAGKYGWDNDVDAMMQSSADLNARDNDGWTALRHMVNTTYQFFKENNRIIDSHKRVIRELVARGANRENIIRPEGEWIPENIGVVPGR
jgi:hypothetical protein